MTKYNTTDCRCGYCEHCAPGDYETIPDDHPIWTEREALMFPDTAGFFADQITESASAMRPERAAVERAIASGEVQRDWDRQAVPTLCLAVCPSHHWSCAAEQPHGNGAHVCNHGGQPHHFFTRKQ